MKFDIKQFSKEELQQLINEANVEINLRKNKAKEEDWDKVVRAIFDYVGKHGDIILSDGIDQKYIDNTADFQEWGVIRLRLF